MSYLTIEFKGHGIQLTDVDYSPGYPAKISGPPEDCHPEEPADISYTIATGNELLDQILEEDHEDEIEGLALKEIESQAIANAEALAEQEYEDQRDRRLGL